MQYNNQEKFFFATVIQNRQYTHKHNIEARW